MNQRTNQSTDKEEQPSQTNETQSDEEATDSPQSNESESEDDESEYDPETDERQRRPGENETEPEGEYNETSPRDVERLPEDAVRVHIDQEEDVTVTRTEILVEGRVTKETSERVDFVDIEILFCNSTGGVLGTSLVVVRELPSEFSTRVSVMELRGEGEFDRVRWNVLPQRDVDE